MSLMTLRKLGLILLLLFLFLVVFHFQAFSQAEETIEQVVLNAEMKASIAEKVGQLLVDNYIFPETAEKMQKLVNSKTDEGKYSNIDDVHDFARTLTKDLQSVSKDRHIRVRFDPDAVKRIKASNSRSEEDRERERKERIEREKRANFGFQKLEIMEGNIGYLDLRYFSGLSQAGDTIVASMNFLANAHAVIIDLRQNGGGSPLTIQVISSYFLDDYTHLNSFEWRGTDSIQQFWTLPYVPGKKMYETDLYILTSRRTFSGAEEFTYNMKNLKRATIVGEATGGGAHPGGPRIVNDYFLVWIPSGRAINPITKTNWEGKGIEPHISVPQDKALIKAHSIALEKLKERTEDQEEILRLQWALDGLKAKTEPVEVEEKILQNYVGKYTRGEIALEDGELVVQFGQQRIKMIPLTDTYFVLDGEDSIRIEFILNNKSGEYEIIAHFSDGTKENVKRVKEKE
jgi:C-terminal processing protease CtpA/Prc